MELLEKRINDIPGRVVHDEHRFKCENGWFAGVYGVVGLGQSRGRLSPETLRCFDEMKGYFRRTSFPERTTEEEDIEMGDNLLAMMLRDYGVEKYLKRENVGGRDGS